MWVVEKLTYTNRITPFTLDTFRFRERANCQCNDTERMRTVSIRTNPVECEKDSLNENNIYDDDLDLFPHETVEKTPRIFRTVDGVYFYGGRDLYKHETLDTYKMSYTDFINWKDGVN